jgi:hypothetical protein
MADQHRRFHRVRATRIHSICGMCSKHFDETAKFGRSRCLGCINHHLEQMKRRCSGGVAEKAGTSEEQNIGAGQALSPSFRFASYEDSSFRSSLESRLPRICNSMLVDSVHCDSTIIDQGIVSKFSGGVRGQSAIIDCLVCVKVSRICACEQGPIDVLLRPLTTM